MWWVYRELSLRRGKLEKTIRPPGRDVEDAARSTNTEFGNEVPAGDTDPTDPGVFITLKVFIALRLNETPELAFHIKDKRFKE